MASLQDWTNKLGTRQQYNAYSATIAPYTMHSSSLGVHHLYENTMSSTKLEVHNIF